MRFAGLLPTSSIRGSSGVEGTRGRGASPVSDSHLSDSDDQERTSATVISLTGISVTT